MTIRTQQSISGFIASDPQLTETDRGEARFYARFGQENYRHESDGTFTKLETSFHNLVIYRATAERAYERVLELQADYVVSLSGLATVRIDEDGKKHIDTPARIMAPQKKKKTI